MNKTAPTELQAFLYNQIPLARALGIQVKVANDESAVVTAPLESNKNHLNTAFGGSLGAVLILSGYTWLYHLMISRGFDCHVLIRRSETDYRRPVDTDFTAIAFRPAPEELERFLKNYEKKGTARISIAAEIRSADPSADQAACLFKGEFVAQKATDTHATATSSTATSAAKA